jgi:hypothetical protein
MLGGKGTRTLGVRFMVREAHHPNPVEESNPVGGMNATPMGVLFNAHEKMRKNSNVTQNFWIAFWD